MRIGLFTDSYRPSINGIVFVVDSLKRELEALGVKEEELKALDKEIRGIVNEAADFAESSPEPEPAELYTDVLVDTY